MAISRLATSNPTADTDILLYTGLRTTLTSVIATNKSSTPARIRVWVVPLDQDVVLASHVHISYDVPISGNDSLETFRFPIVLGDKVYVRASTENISFTLSGVDDTNITGVELETLVAATLSAQTQADKALVYGLIGI